MASATSPTKTWSPWNPVSVKNVVAKRLVSTVMPLREHARVLGGLADEEDDAQRDRRDEPADAASRAAPRVVARSARHSVKLLARSRTVKMPGAQTVERGVAATGRPGTSRCRRRRRR